MTGLGVTNEAGRLIDHEQPERLLLERLGPREVANKLVVGDGGADEHDGVTRVDRPLRQKLELGEPWVKFLENPRQLGIQLTRWGKFSGSDRTRDRKRSQYRGHEGPDDGVPHQATHACQRGLGPRTVCTLVGLMACR